SELTIAVAVSTQSVDSLLLVVPAGAAGSVTPDTVVAGLPLLRRIVLGAAGPVMVSPCPIVIRAANVVPQARWLRALRESELEPERLYADAGATAVVDTDEPAGGLAAATSRATRRHHG